VKSESVLGKKVLALGAIIVLIAAVASLPIIPPAFSDRQNDSTHSHGKGKARGHEVPIEKGWTFNITAAGKATNKTDTSQILAARVTLKLEVTKSSKGGALLKVQEGTLKIGEKTYPVEKGRALLSVRSGRIVIHLVLTGPEGTKLHAILIGKLTQNIPSPFNVNDTVELEFTKPQSKLAGQFFLELKGTFKRVS
jgi:hypothetical protein